MIKTTIVIVNWNTGSLLSKCLKSIKNLPEQELIDHVYVIDNDSYDTSFEDAKKSVADWEGVTCTKLPKNIGFSAANNTVLEGLAGNTHVLLLNPDTEMHPGSLRTLVSELEKNPKAGIIGPKLLNPDGTLQPSVRSFPSFGVLLTFLLKVQSISAKLGLLNNYLQTQFDYSKTQVVDQVMGACFLIRNEAFAKIGILDSRFFVWFEEVDYCKRAKNAGWQTMYTPNGLVTHQKGASFHQVVGFRKTLPLISSVLTYAKKHLPFISVALLYAAIPLSLLLTIPAAIKHAMLRVSNKSRL